MKRFSKTLVLLLAISLIIGSFGSIGVYADESVSSSANDTSAIKSKKPKFSIKVTSDKSGVKITTSKAAYAEGFYIYAKKDGAKKYSKVATISENGKKKIWAEALIHLRSRHIKAMLPVNTVKQSQ